MRDLFFDGEKHEYYYKGEKKPCASDILKLIDCVALDGIPPRNLNMASERGTRTHEATDDYDYGLIDIEDEEWAEENSDIYPYVKAYADFNKDYSGFPVASELPLYCEKTGVAGTIDLVRNVYGELAIIDKKSSSSLKFLRNAIQLNIYRINWNETHAQKVESLYVLHLQNNGKYRLIPIGVDEDLAFKWIGIYNEIKSDKKI